MSSINVVPFLLDLHAQGCLGMHALSCKNALPQVCSTFLPSHALSTKCFNNPQGVHPPYPNQLNEGKVKGHLIQWLRLDEMNGGD